MPPLSGGEPRSGRSRRSKDVDHAGDAHRERASACDRDEEGQEPISASTPPTTALDQRAGEHDRGTSSPPPAPPRPQAGAPQARASARTCRQDDQAGDPDRREDVLQRHASRASAGWPSLGTRASLCRRGKAFGSPHCCANAPMAGQALLGRGRERSASPFHPRETESCQSRD